MWVKPDDMEWWNILIVGFILASILLMLYVDLFKKEFCLDSNPWLIYPALFIPLGIVILWPGKWWSLVLGILVAIFAAILMIAIISNFLEQLAIRKERDRKLGIFRDYLIEQIENEVVKQSHIPYMISSTVSRDKQMVQSVRNFAGMDNAILQLLPPEIGGTGTADTFRYLSKYVAKSIH